MPDARVNQPPVQPVAVFSGVVEPGNGGRYEYIVWKTEDGQWNAAFPDYHAASKIGVGHNYPDYIGEKMRVNRPDAIIMANIINQCQQAASDGGSLTDFLTQIKNG